MQRTIEDVMLDSASILMLEGKAVLLIQKEGKWQATISEAKLVPNSIYPCNPFEVEFSLTNRAATDLIAELNLVPLSQFGFCDRLGWKHIIGDLGKDWDVYVMES